MTSTAHDLIKSTLLSHSVDLSVIIWIALSDVVLESIAVVVSGVKFNELAIASSGTSFQASVGVLRVWGFVVPVTDTAHASISSITE